MANKSKYSIEFHEKALKLADKIGLPKAAEQMGMNYKTLYLWYSERKKQNIKQETKVIEKPREQENKVIEKPREQENKVIEKPRETESPFKRGKIYYISRSGTVGAEISKSRPAIIVSNNDLNKNCDTLEVIFLTTKLKCIAPEHIMIQSSGITSMTVCEQISTIDKSRVREYIGDCTEDEMKAIDKAILSSLGLDDYIAEPINDEQRLIALKAERDCFKQLYNDLLKKCMKK